MQFMVVSVVVEEGEEGRAEVGFVGSRRRVGFESAGRQVARAPVGRSARRRMFRDWARCRIMLSPMRWIAVKWERMSQVGGGVVPAHVCWGGGLVFVVSGIEIHGREVDDAGS